jgi:hypothetical protein
MNTRPRIDITEYGNDVDLHYIPPTEEECNEAIRLAKAAGETTLPPIRSSRIQQSFDDISRRWHSGQIDLTPKAFEILRKHNPYYNREPPRSPF